MTQDSSGEIKVTSIFKFSVINYFDFNTVLWQLYDLL